MGLDVYHSSMTRIRRIGSVAAVTGLILFMLMCLSVCSTGAERSGARNRGRSNEQSAEKRLIRRLLRTYDRIGRIGRPVRNVSTAVTIGFGLGLIQMDLDEKDKILTLSMWTRYSWTDEYLKWNPDDYGGVRQIRLESYQIWIPDIMLYNTADVDTPARTALAVITAEGHVSWYPHCIFRSACSIDVSNFPFDKQTCNLAFGSWTHPSKEVDVEMLFPGGIDLSIFHSEHKDSSAWEVTNVTAQRFMMPSPEEDPNYTVLTFEIFLTRKLVFSSYILTLPCVFLASLTLVVFWLPPERPDRTGLAMSTFSSFMVLLLILVEAAPPTANTIPTLGVYYCFNLVIIMMAVILSSLVVNISRGPHDKKSHLPQCIRVMTLQCMARAMCLSSIYKTNTRKKFRDSPEQEPEAEQMLQFGKFNGDIDNVPKKQYQNLSNTDIRRLELDVSDIRHTLRKMEAVVEGQRLHDRTASSVLQEWKNAALVLDRFFFFLYIGFITISLVLFFPRPTP